MSRTAVFLAACIILVSACGRSAHSDNAASAPVPAEGTAVYYYGVITFIDASTGEFIVAGEKEGVKQEVIVKLKADPQKVYVDDAKGHDLSFKDLAKGDYVDVDAKVENGTLLIENIFLNSPKPGLDE